MENSLVVQWLRLCTSTAEGASLIPGGGTKIPYVVKNKFKKNLKMYVCVYIHIYIHSYIHIYTYTYIHIYNGILLSHKK